MRNVILTSAVLTASMLPLSALANQLDTSAMQPATVQAQTPPLASVHDPRLLHQVFEVRAAGETGESFAQIFDKALYLAASQTLNSRYDWFHIVERKNESGKTITVKSAEVTTDAETVPEKQCDAEGDCTTKYKTYRSDGTIVDFPVSEVTDSAVVLKFEMGLGRVNPGGNVFDARAVQDGTHDIQKFAMDRR